MTYSIWHIPRDAWQPGPTLPSGLDLEAEFTALLPELRRRLAEQLVKFGARHDRTRRR